MKTIQTKNMHRFTALTLALSMGAGIVALPMTARASEEGRRNTALALGATAAALLLTQRNKVPGEIVAGAAVVAASQIGHDRDYDRDHRRDHDYRDDHRDHDNDHRDRDHDRRR